MQSNKTYPATAITLKYFNLGEADKIFLLFSKEHGVIKAVAKGVKKTTSKFGGQLDLLNVNDLLLRYGRNMSTVVQCENFKNFPLLRQDYDKLIYSLFLGELILIFSNEGEPAGDVFGLLLYTLDIIQYTDNPLVYILWFEIQFLAILGYQTNLNNCDICQKEIPEKNNRLGFSLNTGSIICEDCLRLTSNYKLISDDLRNSLKTIRTSGVEELTDFHPDTKLLNKAQDILKEYFAHLSERKIKTLSVFESDNKS